ncbi:LOW QUALITY PROTEIN: hypothetical protein J0S82_009582, partial [Galemys pyrenaicus]
MKSVRTQLRTSMYQADGGAWGSSTKAYLNAGNKSQNCLPVDVGLGLLLLSLALMAPLEYALWILISGPVPHGHVEPTLLTSETTEVGWGVTVLNRLSYTVGGFDGTVLSPEHIKQIGLVSWGSHEYEKEQSLAQCHGRFVLCWTTI